jgi:hypothetical protein
MILKAIIETHSDSEGKDNDKVDKDTVIPRDPASKTITVEVLTYNPIIIPVDVMLVYHLLVLRSKEIEVYRVIDVSKLNKPSLKMIRIMII